MRKKELILTCSLCTHYDSNWSICRLDGNHRDPISDEFASLCNENGSFVRYINVAPDSYNYFAIDEEIPIDWKVDLSKFPKDQYGNPLFVMTKRGLERAIPANDSVTLKSDPIFGVPRIQTFQGQRELIYEIGVEAANEEAMRAGVVLTVLEGEETSTGQDHYKKQREMKESFSEKPNCFWINEKKNEGWD